MQNKKIYSIQALRFVAALMVVHLHAVQTAMQSAGSNGILGQGFAIIGRAGVDIFFVISGVIIARTAPGLTASSFMKKRCVRILPLYFFWCIPSLLIAAKTGFGWRELLATALWPATDRMSMSVLPVAWTLSFEILFYAGAALVLIDRVWLWWLLTFYSVAFALRPFGPLFQFLGNPIILEFLVGAALSYLPPMGWGRACIAAGVAALILGSLLLLPPIGDGTSFLEGRDAVTRLFVLGVPATLIVYGVLQTDLQRGIFSYLGDASYSLYLTHPLIIATIAAGLPFSPFKLPADLIIIGCMSLSVLFAWRAYELAEKPILKFMRERLYSKGLHVAP